MCMLKTRQIYVDDLRNLQITEVDCVCLCMYVCVMYDMYVRTYAMPAYT
jgi:hypothetical protein